MIYGYLNMILMLGVKVFAKKYVGGKYVVKMNTFEKETSRFLKVQDVCKNVKYLLSKHFRVQGLLDID